MVYRLLEMVTPFLNRKSLPHQWCCYIRGGQSVAGARARACRCRCRSEGVVLIVYTAVAVAMALVTFHQRPNAVSTVILNPKNPLFCKATSPTSIHLAGAKYFREKRLAKRRDRKRPSKVWSFNKELIRASDKKPFYYCYECEDDVKEQVLPSLNGITGARDHISSYYSRNPKTGDIIAGAVEPPKDKDKVRTLVIDLSLMRFRQLLVR